MAWRRPPYCHGVLDGESLGQRIERDGRLNEDDAVRIISRPPWRWTLPTNRD